MTSRILHTSDLHLGSGFQGLDPAKRKERRNDLFKVFEKIVRTAKEERVDAVLIVGDLLDAPNPPAEVVDNVVKLLERLGNIQAIIVPGNHDAISSKSTYASASFPDNVVLITKTEFDAVEFPNFTLYAAAYDLKKPDFHPLQHLKISKSDKPIVVAVHGSYIHPKINWKKNPETEDYWPIKPDERSVLRNVAYLALGHYHNFFEVTSAPYTCYPGSPEGISFSETGDRYVSLVTVDDSVSVKKLRLNEKTYDTLEINCTGLTSVEEIEKKIKGEIDKNKLLRVKLKGIISPNVRLNPDKLKEEFDEDFFYLDISSDVHLPETLKLPSHTIKAIYAGMLQKKLKDAKTDRKRRIIQQAIQYGLAALDNYL